MKPVDIKYYPLPNGEFIVSYFDSLTRKRVALTFAAETKATEKYNELRMWKPLKEQKRDLKKCSIDELVRLYLEEVPEAKLRKTPRLVNDFLKQFAIHTIDQIDEVAMRSFYARQKMEYDYTPHSVATRKYQIQGFFKWLKFRGIIEDSPQSKISLGRSKVYRRPLMWVKPDKLHRVLIEAKICSPGFLYPILLFAVETGAREKDIIGLKWSDLDFEKKIVKFEKDEELFERSVPVSAELILAIRQIDVVSDFVFTNLEGRPLLNEILSREIRILKRKVGITKDWVIRDIRHSFAINFLQNGGEIEDLQKYLGHQHLRMTEELYGRYKAFKIDLFKYNQVEGN